MRKLDLLIIRAFIGPFLLTTALSTFILLIQHMLKYFDDFVGKDLGILVFAKLMFYFSLNMLQIALPLGVLVSSLMTFGNLGENFELTAIKSAGISLVRALRPIFFFVLLISIGAFFFNDRVLPIANLKAFSLLYDIRHKKPTLDIEEGVFYKGIPNYTIKAKKKFPDDITLKDVIIYDHTNIVGNKRVILADSSRMYMILNENYLKLELYNGYYYLEQRVRGKKIDQFQRTEYDRMDMVFDLSSFEFDPTDENLFRGNRQMMTMKELTHAIDSMGNRLGGIQEQSFANAVRFFRFKKDFNIPNTRESDTTKTTAAQPKIMEVNQLADARDTFERAVNIPAEEVKTVSRKPRDSLKHAAYLAIQQDFTEDKLDSLAARGRGGNKAIVSTALQQARNVKNIVVSSATRFSNLSNNMNRFKLEKYKKISQAFACIVMFLIGAPLGSIIKKGGLGVPVIISVFFFIIYYVLSITGEEYAKADAMDGQYAVWIANVVLFPIGIFFLLQARKDARILEWDSYINSFMKFRRRMNALVFDILNLDFRRNRTNPDDYGDH